MDGPDLQLQDSYLPVGKGTCTSFYTSGGHARTVLQLASRQDQIEGQTEADCAGKCSALTACLAYSFTRNRPDLPGTYDHVWNVNLIDTCRLYGPCLDTDPPAGWEGKPQRVYGMSAPYIQPMSGTKYMREEDASSCMVRQGTITYWLYTCHDRDVAAGLTGYDVCSHNDCVAATHSNTLAGSDKCPYAPGQSG